MTAQLSLTCKHRPAAPGSARATDSLKTRKRAPVDPDATPDANLEPGFPIVEGRFDMTQDWTINLAQPMNRRIEDDALVLWRPGLTAWITVWGNPKLKSPTIRLGKIKRMSSPHRFAEKEWTTDDLLYYTYRLTEQAEDTHQSALYGNVVSITGHVQVATYFDNEADLASATALIGHITANGPQTRAALSSPN